MVIKLLYKIGNNQKRTVMVVRATEPGRKSHAATPDRL